MSRIQERILLSDKSGKEYLTPINQFNLKKDLSGIDTVRVGEKTLWPFGDYQVKIDERYKQKKNKTILETYYKGHNPIGKGFKIIRISRGEIHGVPEKYNKYIVLLERVY